MWNRRLACLPKRSKHVLNCRTSSRLARCISHASGKVSPLSHASKKKPRKIGAFCH
jgi:hypothetical protein